MNIGPAEITVIAVILGLLAAVVVIPVWAIVHALRSTDAQWRAVGQNRYVWVVLIAAGTVLGGFFGLVLAIVYLASVRPQLARAGSTSTPG